MTTPADATYLRDALRAAAGAFTRKEVLPSANELDPISAAIPPRLRELMSGMGFFGVIIPEEFGGLGLGTYEYCLVAEELSRGWMSVASMMARGNGMGLTAGLNDHQKHALLPGMAEGRILGAAAISEPEAGSDVASLSCRATRTNEGWSITGQKMWCTFAQEADFIAVWARTDPIQTDSRARGVSCFLVMKEPGVFPEGLSGTPIRKIGYHGMSTWELSFENVNVGDDALVGTLGEGFRLAMDALQPARLHTAARAIGLAQGALEDAASYATSRVQFGSPIKEFQAIRFDLADMATQIEAARRMLYSICEEVDAGATRIKEASMVKLFATQMAERVTSMGLQIHGGAGYTTDFAAERYWRDARLTTIFEGTSEIQKVIISDSMLGKV